MLFRSVAAHAPGNALAGKGYVAGIDLGGTKVLAAIFSPDGSIVSRAKVVTGRIGGLDVVERMAAAVRETLVARFEEFNLEDVALVERLQQLPGFSQQKLDNAMRDAAAGKSRTDANLWKRGAAEATPVQEEASHDASGQP